MTALEQALSDYLKLRRRLGYYLERNEPELGRFVCFLEQAGAERITTELALRWARMPANQHPIIWRWRLGKVRQFARYLATIDPASEIPSKDLLPAHQPRVAPYIYSPQPPPPSDPARFEGSGVPQPVGLTEHVRGAQFVLRDASREGGIAWPAAVAAVATALDLAHFAALRGPSPSRPTSYRRPLSARVRRLLKVGRAASRSGSTGRDRSLGSLAQSALCFPTGKRTQALRHTLRGVWIPRDFSDVTRAVGYLAEGEQLDFKLAATRPADAQDLAKDVAAMSLAGGVIVIGVDEDGGLAARVEHFALAGQPERIQQIIDARVRPPPSVRIQALSAQPAGSEGVIAIIVMPSTSAPHMVGERFPARSGATARYLSEREVDDWYERRRVIRDRAAELTGMAGFVAPPDGELAPPRGVGRMRLQVRPAVDVAHPDEPRLRSALEDAHSAAAGTLASFVRAEFTPASFSWLREWTPRGSTGWAAGEAGTANMIMPFERKLVASTYLYGQGFSFQVVLGLVPRGLDFWVAYEHLWVAEAMALLSLAGHFFADLPVASPLRCDVELVGLAGGLSFTESYREPVGFLNQPGVPRVTDTLYEHGGSFQARDLADDPRHAVGALLDRLLVAIVPEHVDLISRIAP